MSYRIPANEEYCKELGRAVYNFAYWEWIILWTIETLENGFLNEYRHAKMPSGGVAKRLQKAIQNKKHDLTSAIHSRLIRAQTRFLDYVDTRNDLIHAHPYTADGGTQQLIKQNASEQVTWPLQDVTRAAKSFEDAACEDNTLFFELRKELGIPS